MYSHTHTHRITLFFPVRRIYSRARITYASVRCTTRPVSTVRGRCPPRCGRVQIAFCCGRRRDFRPRSRRPSAEAISQRARGGRRCLINVGRVRPFFFFSNFLRPKNQTAPARARICIRTESERERRSEGRRRSRKKYIKYPEPKNSNIETSETRLISARVSNARRAPSAPARTRTCDTWSLIDAIGSAGRTGFDGRRSFVSRRTASRDARLPTHRDRVQPQSRNRVRP